jgi:hypothetical protein
VQLGLKRRCRSMWSSQSRKSEEKEKQVPSFKSKVIIEENFVLSIPHKAFLSLQFLSCVSCLWFSEFLHLSCKFP